jgi:hypothetical protein
MRRSAKQIATFKKRLTHAGIALSLSAAAAFGHHSYTSFDMATTLTLAGTVKEFQWTNPHVWIQLIAKDTATGKDVEWSIESDSPNMLKRRGWTRKSLQPGDKAVVVIHPQRISDDRNRGALESLLVNGQRIGELVTKPAGEARQ